MSIFNNILQILIFFIHFHVHLKIAIGYRNYLSNRVETCHFPNKKPIDRYLMTEVYDFHI